jgi:phosphohistidine phosphatase SixA
MLHRNIRPRCAAAILALALAGPALAERVSSPAVGHALEGAALVRALRAGGLTLYFRHAATDFSQNDRAMGAYGECATQRNLSEAGRAQARAIGEAIRALKLPVGEVIASPFCRTMDTGRLMFGRAEPSTVVRGYEGTNAANADYTALVALLASPPKPGTLRMITSHGNPFRAVAGPPHLEEGEAAVLKPAGADFLVIARIRRGDWAALVAEGASAGTGGAEGK